MLVALVALLTPSSLAEETVEPKVKVVSQADIEAEVDLEDEVEALTEAQKLEQLDKKVKVLFTEKFGEAWNAARECDLERNNKNPWNEIDIWIDKKWMPEGLHYIDEQKWTDWVVNAPKGSKPWLIDFGWSNLSAPTGDGLFNTRVARHACLAKHLSHLYNIGFGDYRKAENILESYDFEWGQYGMMAPLQLVIKDGMLYQLPQSNIHLIYYAEFLQKLEESVYITPVLLPRNELNIYWEYVKRDLGSARLGAKLDRFVRKMLD